MDLLRKSYPSVVLRSSPPAIFPSISYKGKCSGAGGYAIGVASQQGATYIIYYFIITPIYYNTAKAHYLANSAIFYYIL